LLIHPGYDPNLEEHDIGLIHLRQPVSLQPVFLPQAGDEHLIAPGRMHTILGWGATDTFLSWGSDTLLKANVPIVDDSICNLPFAYDGEVTQNMICAGYMAGGTDACSGDSGGPLLTLEDNHWYATGIVSWGYGCASPNLPGVYTKVMNYIGWIKQHVDSIQQPPTGVQNIVQQSVRIYNDGNALLIWNEGEIHLRKIQLLTAGAALVEEQAASAEGKNLMSLQHLAQGVYVVKIITDEGIVTRKVLR
jgi:secreted trypsin-like serine protease